MKILIVEDDIKISSFLQKGLTEENYTVDCTFDGEDALYLIQNNIYDVILLDLMIPSLNGIELCSKVREEGIHYPIIMLTAKSMISDKVIGLTQGANDYITKPFSFEELLARIKVQLRSGKSLNNILQVDDLYINTNTKEVRRANENIILTSKEYNILEYMVLNQQSVITETMINESLLNMDESTASNIVNVYIYRLRNKIDKNHSKKLIHTVRGMGYKIASN
jgi:DNA-binding response OmpR family regulator